MSELGARAIPWPSCGPVFRGRQGGPLSPSTPQRWLDQWIEGAGLQDDEGNRYTLHSLRRLASMVLLSEPLRD